MLGVAKRSTDEVDETATRSNNATAVNSLVNWHFPGGTRALIGGPVRLEMALLADDIVEAARFTIVLGSISKGFLLYMSLSTKPYSTLEYRRRRGVSQFCEGKTSAVVRGMAHANPTGRVRILICICSAD